MTAQTTDWVSNLKINDVFHSVELRMECMVTALPDKTYKTYRVASSDGSIRDIGPIFIRINCAPGPLEKPEKTRLVKMMDADTLEDYIETRVRNFPADIQDQIYGMLAVAITTAYECGRRHEAESQCFGSSK